MTGEEKVQSFKDLRVWQQAMQLAVEVYEVSKLFPIDERFGLTAQIRRAAVSVPSNIAEGQARRSTAEFQHFLSHAMGSLAEVETQLLLAKRLGYCDEQKLNKPLASVVDVRMMLHALRNRLEDRR